MGHKIFVSYKYADPDVASIAGGSPCTPRDYVDKIEKSIDESDHIFKGESDGDDLSNLSDDAIWERLKHRIYDSTLTVVMISRGMRESSSIDKNQWIPREISYSLKEVSRIDESGNAVASKTNAMLAVVIPDSANSYGYFIDDKVCCTTGCRLLYRDNLFDILKTNMFNIKKPNARTCSENNTIYYGESSYIPSVKWEDFIGDMNRSINRAYAIQENMDDYKITKEL